MFEVRRIYCSDITGLGVRSFPDLMFEVERILHTIDGTDVDGLFQVYVNGQMLSFCTDGINTVLKDGDTVAICANVLEGCCGGSLGIN